MDKQAVMPTLSEDSWVTDSDSVASYLFSHFLLSNYSQSYIYKERVASLAWVLHETQGKIGDTIELLRSTLVSYFSAYFTGVECEVSDVTPNRGSKVELSIYLAYIGSDGKKTQLSKAFEIQDGKLLKLLNYSNYGI